MNDAVPPSAELFSTPGNPVPDGAVTGLLNLRDGVYLRYARWPAADQASRGTVVLLHGRTECIEKYFETIADFRARGFDVVTFDWRGQGGSTRLLKDPRPGHVEHFNQYLDDLEAILVDVALPDCRPPYDIVAHSTGGLVALLAAPALSNRIRRMMLLSPLLRINNLPVRQVVLQRLTGFLSYVGFGRKVVPGLRHIPERRPFDKNLLTSDSVRYQRNGEIFDTYPQLSVGGPTNAWLFAACRAMQQVADPRHAAAVSIPTLLVAAGADPIVDPAAVERYGDRMRAGAFLTIAAARHELLQESNIHREQVLAAFDAFVGSSKEVEA